MRSAQKEKKKPSKKKRVSFEYSKNWNKINLLPMILLFVATLFTVAMVNVNTHYDFRQRAQTLSPIPLPTSLQPTFEQISITPVASNSAVDE